MTDQVSQYIKERIQVSPSELEIILTCFRPYYAKKNEILIHQGQTGQRTFFVGKGCLRIFFNNEQGQDTTRYVAFENNFATGLVSFITGEPSQEFIQAVENSDLLYISQQDFYHLLEIIPSWDKFYRIYLEKAYVNNTNRLMSFVTMNAKERYVLLLEQNPAIVARLPNKLVASYLNISQETLSRLKAKM
ncbi:cyclic nucleotide-binding domain-containing protein [Dyadobacter frigoris]|uniref:Cyclic nucleotide-binding domain-containing protein n=1 Tax=Dyadobacter frigoris TaxID=2576211 RepID=A0A4U6CXT1_9BACT|nr:cyclic nucleotide-binding domain-containing protein [Dyadobacter frigoris]